MTILLELLHPHFLWKLDEALEVRGTFGPHFQLNHQVVDDPLLEQLEVPRSARV